MRGPSIAFTIYLVLFVVAGCDTNSPATPAATDSRVDDVARNVPTDERIESTAVSLEPATEPMDGYLLIAPLRSTETYLLNKDKQIVHRWTSKYPPSGTAYLLPNGDLLRGARDPDFKDFRGGGIGGLIERFRWDGELIWTFRYANQDHCLHHDIELLPNGNILMIAWERKSREDAIAAGRDPDLLEDDLWPDHVIEVEPDGPEGGKIVWEWHMWDHLIQDFDREKPNYGVIYEHPELIDLNNVGSTPPATAEDLRKLRAVGYTGGGDGDDNRRRIGADWMHTNAIDYHPELDQIALSAKHFSEIWIIDHSTTTEEAASHRGGKSGKGGDLLYRWGNPWAYKSGTASDQMLFDQHDVRWIPASFPGAGNLTAFNNGPGRRFSSIVEVRPPLDAKGNYALDDDGRFGPHELAWEYTEKNKEDFFSSFISGAMRLPNGNTLICEGATGRVFEVNSQGEKLWEYVNEYGGELDRDGRPNDAEAEARKLVEGGGQRSFLENNALFRATKILPSDPALAGKTLEPLADPPVPFAVTVEEAVARLKAASDEARPAEEADDSAAEEAAQSDDSAPAPQPAETSAGDESPASDEAVQTDAPAEPSEEETADEAAADGN